MNAAQIRARMQEIQARLAEIQNGEITDAVVTEVDTLSKEIEDLNAKLATAEKLEASLAKISQSAGRVTGPAAAPKQVTSVVDNKSRFGGFDSTGSFLAAVRQAAGGQMDERLRASAMQEKVGEDGGFLVPEDINEAVQKKFEDPQESLMARAKVLKVSGNALTLPIDENVPWNQGVVAYWTGESKQMTESKNQIGQASWRLHKLAALVRVTEELLEDGMAMESYIKGSAPDAITSKVNDAIISGDGVGKPKGILSSGFTITQAKESGQSADTIVAENIIKMYSRMLPNLRAGAVWLINAGCESALMGMKDADGRYIYLAPGSQMNNSPYGILLGRPVIPMMSALPALGDLGDIVFANFSYYYAIVKAAGVKQSVSSHLYFDRDQVAYKFTYRVDGSVPFKAPVAAQYGSHTASAFVILEAR